MGPKKRGRHAANRQNPLFQGFCSWSQLQNPSPPNLSEPPGTMTTFWDKDQYNFLKKKHRKYKHLQMGWSIPSGFVNVKMALFHPQDNANVGWGFIPQAAKYSLITCGWGEYIAHLFLVTLVHSTCFKSSRLWNGEVYPKYLTLGCMVNPIQPWMSCTSLACFRLEEHLPNCQVDYSYLQVLPVQCHDRFSKCATWGATALTGYTIPKKT